MVFQTELKALLALVGSATLYADKGKEGTGELSTDRNHYV
jgi:hypothetical protein